jgi:spore germination protein KC
LSIEGTIGELRCSIIKTKNDIERFEDRIGDQVEEQLLDAISTYKQQKIDAFGIGNQIYRKHPKLWKRLEPTWDKQLTQIQYQIAVNIEVLSTGMNVGTPFGEKEK